MIYIHFDLYVSTSIGEFIQCMCGCLHMPEEGFEYPGAGIAGYCDLNSSPREEQQTALTSPAPTFSPLM